MFTRNIDDNYWRRLDGAATVLGLQCLFQFHRLPALARDWDRQGCPSRSVRESESAHTAEDFARGSREAKKIALDGKLIKENQWVIDVKSLRGSLCGWSGDSLFPSLLFVCLFSYFSSSRHIHLLSLLFFRTSRQFKWQFCSVRPLPSRRVRGQVSKI